MTEPLLSVIATCRNDDYGGNMLDRLHFFIRSIDRFEKIRVEIIIIEWNPDMKKESMHDILAKWHVEKRFGHPIRIITVSKDKHEEFKTRMQLRFNMFGMRCFDFQEYPAKNVGIRNAKGKYILITNPDNYFTMDIINEIEELCQNGFLNDNYKGARRGRTPDVRQFEKFKANNDLKLMDDVLVKQFKEFDVGCDGDFMLLSRENVLKMKGYIEYPFCWTHFEIPFNLRFLHVAQKGITLTEYCKSLSEKYFNYQYPNDIKNLHYHFDHFGSGNCQAKSGGSSERSILNRLGNITWDMIPPEKFAIENTDDWGMNKTSEKIII